jgi:outer membrane protein assembly factor BamA
VIGLRRLTPAAVVRHLASKAGAPFRRADIAIDTRRLDELRLFSAVTIEPLPEAGGVVLDVTVTETLRVLPTIAVRVTDANGVSAGAGMRSINLFGHGAQAGVSALFGGETSVGAAVDTTTITPGTWALHTAVSYVSRENTLYDFHERATSAELRTSRNLAHGLRVGGVVSLLVDDTGSSTAALSPDGTDVMPTLGTFVTFDTLDSSTNPRNGTWAEAETDYITGDANSWTFIADGRRFQRLSARHGIAGFALASFQTGEVDVTLPEYLQFALGGANTIRGWSLGSRNGRNQFIGSAEYTFVVRQVAPFSIFGLNAYGGLQLAAFADSGLAWNHSADRESAINGYGVGLRVLVPFVDLVRIDVAWGEPGQGATAYLGISLKAARQRQRVR